MSDITIISVGLRAAYMDAELSSEERSARLRDVFVGDVYAIHPEGTIRTEESATLR